MGGVRCPTSSAAGGGSRLLPLPWSRALRLRPQLPPPGPVATQLRFKRSAGSNPQQQCGVRAQCLTARLEPGCEFYHPEGERLPGAGDLAGRGGRADREAEKVVLPAWEEPRLMSERWSRVVWVTPGTDWAAWQTEEGEATAETGRHVGQEAWIRGEAETGAQVWRAAVTVLCTCLEQTLFSSAHQACRLISGPPQQK